MKYTNITWLSDKDYAQAFGQMRLGMPEAFRSFQVDDEVPIRYMYGLEVDVKQAIEEVVRR